MPWYSKNQMPHHFRMEAFARPSKQEAIPLGILHRPHFGCRAERVRHALCFSWLDDRIWLRVYRLGIGLDGTRDLSEIGPRLVLQPVRVIASGFSGAILSSHEGGATNVAGEEDPD